jgi:hypothetical protein
LITSLNAGATERETCGTFPAMIAGINLAIGSGGSKAGLPVANTYAIIANE